MTENAKSSYYYDIHNAIARYLRYRVMRVNYGYTIEHVEQDINALVSEYIKRKEVKRDEQHREV